MATLAVQTGGRAGSDLTTLAAAAAVGGDKITNTGVEHLVVVNADVASKTVTIAWGTGGTLDGATPTAKTVVVGAGKTAIIGPFPTQLYNDANGQVAFTYSAVTSLSVLAWKPGT